jgi:hypothetical protein
VVGEKEPLRARLAGLGALLLALALALAPAVAHGEDYRALGACRAGVPNGGYELRDADGALRVAGAFAQGHLTGTFIFWTAGGARLAVLPFDDDAKNGTVALWYAVPNAAVESGRRLEAPYVDDLPHGIQRSWHANGRPRAEYRYEQGVLADARAWTEAGEPLSDAAARGQAATDAAANAQIYAALLALIHDHGPPCG